MPRLTVAALSFALFTWLFINPASACVVTDTNPCSSWSGPFGHASERKAAKVRKAAKPKKYHKRQWAKRTKTNIFRSYQSASTSRTCLTSDTQAVLNRLESKFGAVKIVSTCRAGATIAGTRTPSQHRYGKAVDFEAPSGRKSEVVKWLYANNRGLVMTYARMSHVHFDTGSYHAIACGGCVRRTQYASARKRHRVEAQLR